MPRNIFPLKIFHPDTSSRDHQPMLSAGDRHVIVSTARFTIFPQKLEAAGISSRRSF
jgi:hypothetical protein